MTKTCYYLRPLTRTTLKAYLENYSYEEAATYFGVSKRTIARRCNKYDLKVKEYKYGDIPDTVTIKQQNIITGTLLGDSYLQKISGRAKNSRFSIDQSHKHIEYLQYVYDALMPFSTGELRKKITKSINSGKKIYTGNYVSYQFETIHWPLFTELREKWYPKGIKIVPNDINLNWEIVAHWACTDGCNNPSKKHFTFYTNSFSEQDVELLKYKLQKQMNIKTHISHNNKRQPLITVGAREYFDFIEQLKPHIPFECFQHKVDTSKAPITKPNYGTKLNLTKAKEIRYLYYHKNVEVKKIAEIYNVSQPTIGKIINNLTYKQKDMSLGGTSIVTYGY